MISFKWPSLFFFSFTLCTDFLLLYFFFVFVFCFFLFFVFCFFFKLISSHRAIFFIVLSFCDGMVCVHLHQNVLSYKVNGVIRLSVSFSHEELCVCMKNAMWSISSLQRHCRLQEHQRYSFYIYTTYIYTIDVPRLDS